MNRKYPLTVTLLSTLALIVAALFWNSLRSPFGKETVLFLGWDPQDSIQLYRIHLGDSSPDQLTSKPANILDYAPSPNGESIAYVTEGDEGGSNIWLIDADGGNSRELLSCINEFCSTIVWHPDSRRLTYERQQLADDGLPGAPQLWWLDTVSLETTRLLQKPDSISLGASFSPDGKWLSYVGSPDEGIFGYNLDSGERFQIPGEMGTPVVWSPDSQRLLSRNNQLVVAHGDEEEEDHLGHTHDFSLGVYLFITELSSGERAGIAKGDTSPLSGEELVDDGIPVWSPDGEWIAFGRKQPRTSMGRQLWLVRPDGTGVRALTDRPEIHHGVPSWSHDGESLLFQRFSILEPDKKPGIWLLDVATGEMEEISSPGFQPMWQP